MKSLLNRTKSIGFFTTIVLVQLIVWTLTFLDVPIARQFVGFIYLTFVPGFVLVKLLNLEKLDRLEVVVFSIGLSIAFLMLTGFVTNELSDVIGFGQPLSTLPLTVATSVLVLVFSGIVRFRSQTARLFGTKNVELSASAILLNVLPILTIVGAMLVNMNGNNSILLLVLTCIAVFFVLATITAKRLTSKFYAIAVFMIAISLLYQSSLISKNLVSFGSDNPFESFVFKTTKDNLRWVSTYSYPGNPGYGRLNSMLSVTILPTIYSVLLNIDPTWVFKALYPLIFAFVPLGLYQLWQKNFGKMRAFGAAFLFMAQNTFYTEMLGLNRQMIAELFFALLLLVIYSKQMRAFEKWTCFAIFGFALITSHYAIAEIFLLFILVPWILLVIMKRRRHMTIGMIVLFAMMMFSWYLYTSNAVVLDSFTSFGTYVYEQLGQFLNPVSRGQTVLFGLGIGSSPSTWNTIGRAFAYLTELFIVLGCVTLFTKHTEVRPEEEYLLLTGIGMAFLVALIVVPGLANTLNMTRFYHILLFFLAPLCLLGVESVAKVVLKRKATVITSILLVSVLVPYFLFQTGFVYEIVGIQNYSLPLSKYRMDSVFLRSSYGYFDEAEVTGALWMSERMSVIDSTTYADASSINNVLSNYGMIFAGNMEPLTNVTLLSANSYVYLNRVNVIDGVIPGKDLWNITTISPALGSANKVYSNGECEVYKNR